MTQGVERAFRCFADWNRACAKHVRLLTFRCLLDVDPHCVITSLDRHGDPAP